jgi:hypothetical protein
VTAYAEQETLQRMSDELDEVIAVFAETYAQVAELHCARRMGASAIATATARRNSSAGVGQSTPNPAHHVLIIRTRNTRMP